MDLKSNVWSTLGSEDETMFCDTQNFFQLDCRLEAVETFPAGFRGGRMKGQDVMTSLNVACYAMLGTENSNERPKTPDQQKHDIEIQNRLV